MVYTRLCDRGRKTRRIYVRRAGPARASAPARLRAARGSRGDTPARAGEPPRSGEPARARVWARPERPNETGRGGLGGGAKVTHFLYVICSREPPIQNDER